MFKKVLPVLLCTLIAAAAVSSSASAQARKATLRVSASASQSGPQATYDFRFSGGSTSGFQLALPPGTLLKSRRFATLGHYLSLETTGGRHLASQMTAAEGHSVSVDLDRTSGNFKVRFNTAALAFTAAEEKRIRSGQVSSITLTFTFMGAAEQFATARLKLHV